MRKRLRLADSRKTLVLLSVLLLNACASSPQIRANTDKNADFSAYYSYGFIEPLGTDKAGYTTLVTKYLRDAVSDELEKRGYVFSSDPDLLVNFFARLENRIQITSAPTPIYYGGYYDYRHGIYDSYPRYIYRPYSYSYKEGTVNVDLIDAKKKQMVWEGVAVNVVDAEELDNPEQALRKVIADIFIRYPFRAGSARDVTDRE